jgi:phospholipase C
MSIDPRSWRRHGAAVCTALVCAGTVGLSTPVRAESSAAAALSTATPIKHLVVIFDENVSFDHYFATYPRATNPPGEPAFHGLATTPGADTLAAARILTNNPNLLNSGNGSNANAYFGSTTSDPFRLDRSQASTADQNHAYTAEQQAYDGGKADLFPRYTGKGTPGGVGAFATTGQVMGYFDGNTVTALWQYAQHFAMSDRAYSDTYGPSTPGALEVVAGQTNGMLIGASAVQPSTVLLPSFYINDGAGGYTMMNDVDPTYDTCSNQLNMAMMTGKNIGDLLTAANVSWGGFMGGFDLSVTNPNGTTGCVRSTQSHVVGNDVLDYIPHHNWFAYYASTANASHSRPSSTAAIGSTLEADGKTVDPANHEYDLRDFYAALKAGNFPAVSYIKAAAFEDAHAGYSDPLDEQRSLVTLVNFIEHQPGWQSTAIIITYDDSDGWYDHAAAKVTSPSFDAAADQLDGPGVCGAGTPLAGVAGKPVNGRCGPGTRLPFLVVSPYARANAISHDPISLASIPRFIEDNWLHGARLGGGSFDATAGSLASLFDFQSGARRPPLFLDPTTGEPLL